MAKKALSEGIVEHFESMEDPRCAGMVQHQLIDIVAISICAMICNADGWEDIEDWAKDHEEWLRSWLTLENGIPSHDTIRRLFILLDPKMFASCFFSWIEDIRVATQGRLIAIDGKSARGSHKRSKGVGPIHIVTAWAQENATALAQIKTEQKSNEITAIPQLLDMIDLEGTITTIDAMGCQKDIASKIISGGGDYVLALKENQRGLRAEAEALFDEVEGQPFDDVQQRHIRVVDNTHGRHVVRDYTLIDPMRPKKFDVGWEGLRCFGKVYTQTTVDGETIHDTRYYITSLPCQVKTFAKSVRGHWSIENTLHWRLDVGLREDASRIRTGNAPENLACLRKLVLQLLSKEKTYKRGIAAKRKRAAWSPDYLLRVLEAN